MNKSLVVLSLAALAQETRLYTCRLSNVAVTASRRA